MNSFSNVPPGFRFHPTDEELVDYYLRKKIAARKIDLDVIKDVDLYKIEPWDIEEKCKIGVEEQSDWYFFSHKDKKYPTGTRTNRATTAGFWKATGRDKPIYSKNNLVGMRKTLVFYKGRAPNGQKSDWIMHEYRLETNENAAPQEEGWVVCRVFKKKLTATTTPTMRRFGEYDSPCAWYIDDNNSYMPNIDASRSLMPNIGSYNQNIFSSCKPELISELHYNMMMPQDPNLFLQLPNLEIQTNYISQENTITDTGEHVTDWRVLDKFVASQLSHDEVVINASKDKQEAASDHASTSNSSNQIDKWK